MHTQKLKKVRMFVATVVVTLAAAGGVAFAHEGGDKREQKREQERAEILAKYDANQDGKLDDAERERLHADRAAERFARLDTNGDGVLSRDEFAAERPHHRGANAPKSR